MSDDLKIMAAPPNESVFLISELKRSRTGLHGILLKMETLQKSNGNFSLRCLTFDLFFPRKDAATREHASRRSCKSTERSAAASDKLSAETFLQASVHDLLFDYMASMGGHIRNAAGAQAMQVLTTLADRRSLSTQLNMADSQFRVFSVKLCLESYCNHLIDLFSGKRLFDWLRVNHKEQGLAEYGNRALLFSRDVVVEGSHSLLFLTFNPDQECSLSLLVVCQTNGKNLGDFMFRGQRNVAVTVAKAIAIEGVGMIYNELVTAATSLHREHLWRKASTATARNHPTNEEIMQLIDLCFLTPINLRLFDLLNDDCRNCCESMISEPMLQPSHHFVHKSQQHWIFSIENVFLLARAENSGSIAFYIMSRSGSDAEALEESSAFLIQKIANYMLHDIWKREMSGMME